MIFFELLPFLAHLSRRIIGKLIGYSWSGVPPSAVRLSTMLKDLLQNRLANQSQILCGASFGRGNESLFAAFRSHDQDCHHQHQGLQPIIVCSNDDPGLPGVTLTYFTARSNFVT